MFTVFFFYILNVHSVFFYILNVLKVKKVKHVHSVMCSMKYTAINVQCPVLSEQTAVLSPPTIHSPQPGYQDRELNEPNSCKTTPCSSSLAVLCLPTGAPPGKLSPSPLPVPTVPSVTPPGAPNTTAPIQPTKQPAALLLQ